MKGPFLCIASDLSAGSRVSDLLRRGGNAVFLAGCTEEALRIALAEPIQAIVVSGVLDAESWTIAEAVKRVTPAVPVMFVWPSGASAVAAVENSAPGQPEATCRALRELAEAWEEPGKTTIQ